MTDFPTEAKYMRVKNYNDKVLARHTTRISPFNGAKFGPSQVDRLLFNIPSETGMEIDMDTLMFHFNAKIQVSTTGTYDVAFCNSMESVIQSLRIRKGTSFLLEDIQRYNYLDSMFMNYMSDDYNKCVGSAVMGIQPYQNRYSTIVSGAGDQLAESTARNYCIPFRLSGISNYSGLISTSLIDSVCAFQFEIELAPARDAIQVNNTTTGAAPATASYELNECYITYDIVRMAPEYHQQLQASIQRGIPLQIPYKTWRTSLYNLPVTGTMHTFNINDTVKSLNSIFIGFFKQGEQGYTSIPGKDRKHKPPQLKTIQLQLGSFYYPLQPMDCQLESAQSFLELQKALGLTYVRSEYTGPFGFEGRYYTKNGINQVTDLGTGVSYAVPEIANNTAADVNKGGLTVLKSDTGIALNDGGIVGNIANATGAAIPAANGSVTWNAGTFTKSANVSATSIQRFYQQCCQGPHTEYLIGFNLRKVLDAVEGEIVGTDIQSSGSGLMTLRIELNNAEATGPYNIVIASLYDAVLEIQSNQQTFRVE